MGTLSGGDGGGWPPDELPDLPPEWGRIVIPDDASELARDARRVRREMRRDAWERRWRRRLHLPPAPPRSTRLEGPSMGVPLLVISIAVIATLTSLFAIAWPTRAARPGYQPTAVATTPGGRPAATPSARAPAGGTAGSTAPTPSHAPALQTGTVPAQTTGDRRPPTGQPAAAGTDTLPDLSKLHLPDFPLVYPVSP